MSRGDRIRRTSCDATRARSATGASRRICRELQGCQDFCEEKPGPELLVNQHRALAMPSNAGSCCKIALENRTGIDITLLRSSKLAQKHVDLLQLRLDHIVIIIAQRVAGDAPLL